VDVVLRIHGEGLRMVLIEDTYEMTAPPGATNFEHLHTCDQADLRTLIHTTMRLSPEFIIVGEVRGPEAWICSRLEYGARHECQHHHAIRRWRAVAAGHVGAAGGGGGRSRADRQHGECDCHHGADRGQLLRVRELARCQGWDGQRYVLEPITER